MTRPAEIDTARARRAFLAHIRHELRTPADAISAYCEMLLEDARARGAVTLTPELEKIQTAGARLSELISELLDPAGALAAEAEEATERLQSHIRHELRTPLNAIIGYSEMLLEDAADEGDASFAPELESILTAGRRALALTEDIAHLWKASTGELDSEFSAPDVSSMVRDAVTTIRALDADERLVREGEGGHILVVDDNETNRDLLTRRLERQGYQVSVAENGLEALQKIGENEYDLVLLDIMMPELNGFQVLEQVKSDDRTMHIPVIMMSALTEVDSVVRCIEIGAEDYLTKPFNPVLLRARISACLEKKRLRDREVMHLRQIEDEKKRADELLHVILPNEIVEELKSTNAVTPRLYENVAVLFCDVVEFTPFCEQRAPEEVISHLQALIEAYEDLTLRYDMQKIKTIGDSFMATAGLLNQVQNPVLNCVRCGLEMIATARELPAGWTVRVGIHVGPVMAGVVGHRQYLFDLWGDTVNTAARVESHGANGAVNVSERAWQAISGQCTGRSLGRIFVKGKGEMQIHRVEALIPAAPPPVDADIGVPQSDPVPA